MIEFYYSPRTDKFTVILLNRKTDTTKETAQKIYNDCIKNNDQFACNIAFQTVLNHCWNMDAVKEYYKD